jgi:hypothetical protein
VLAGLFFERGYHSNLLIPTGDRAYVIEKDATRRFSKNGMPQVSEDYPKFNAFVYSAETFAPLLKRKRLFNPVLTRRWGSGQP